MREQQRERERGGADEHLDLVSEFSEALLDTWLFPESFKTAKTQIGTLCKIFTPGTVTVKYGIKSNNDSK